MSCVAHDLTKPARTLQGVLRDYEKTQSEKDTFLKSNKEPLIRCAKFLAMLCADRAEDFAKIAIPLDERERQAELRTILTLLNENDPRVSTVCIDGLVKRLLFGIVSRTLFDTAKEWDDLRGELLCEDLSGTQKSELNKMQLLSSFAEAFEANESAWANRCGKILDRWTRITVVTEKDIEFPCYAEGEIGVESEQRFIRPIQEGYFRPFRALRYILEEHLTNCVKYNRRKNGGAIFKVQAKFDRDILKVVVMSNDESGPPTKKESVRKHAFGLKSMVEVARANGFFFEPAVTFLDSEEFDVALPHHDNGWNTFGVNLSIA